MHKLQRSRKGRGQHTRGGCGGRDRGMVALFWGAQSRQELRGRDMFGSLSLLGSRG